MTAENARIRELENEVIKRDNTILMQQNSIDELKRQVDNLTEIIILVLSPISGIKSVRSSLLI